MNEPTPEDRRSDSDLPQSLSQSRAQLLGMIRSRFLASPNEAPPVLTPLPPPTAFYSSLSNPSATPPRLASSWDNPTPPNKPGSFKRFLMPILTIGFVLFKLLGKLKFLIIPIIKWIPMMLKTGGSMVLTMWVYAISLGWPYAVGFVLLLLVHECGHLIAARKLGLDVGAPVFIPFMGAFIALRDAPKNAWIEALVGIGGPLLGSAAAAACHGVFLATQKPLFLALAYSGYILNLFNLLPVGFLDGGRIVTALSPWLWLCGFVGLVVLVWAHPNFLLVLILLFSLPRLFSLFRKRSTDEQRFFEVTPRQRWIIGVLYFGLITLLAAALYSTRHHQRPTPGTPEPQDPTLEVLRTPAPVSPARHGHAPG